MISPQNPTEILVDENVGKGCAHHQDGELPAGCVPKEEVRWEIPGSEYEMDCDTVIMSLGTSPNPLISSTTKGLETNRRKCIVATEDTGATSKDGVYAGGDAQQVPLPLSLQWEQVSRLERVLMSTFPEIPDNNG